MIDDRGNYPSCSGLARIISCRGSWLAERELSESTVGKSDRDEGSLLHSCMEDGKIPAELDDDQKWALRCAMDLRDKFYENFNILGDKLREVRLWAHRPDLTPLFSGKFDEAVIGPDFCSIVDYKFGRIPVSPADTSIQMLGYAILLHRNYPGRSQYAVSVIQPRVESAMRFSVSSYSPDELETNYQILLRVLKDANKPNRKRTPSYAACQYCKAFPVRCLAAFDHFTTIKIHKRSIR